MKTWTIKGNDGRAVQVQAFDWMMAMCEAIEQLDIEVDGWACRPAGRGMLVTDPTTGSTWRVVPGAIDAPTPSRGAASLPPSRRGATASPTDLAERLFERSAEITAASGPHQACQATLRVALDLVPCEAGSVLRGGLNDDALTFVAASGPAARALLGRQVPFGQGLVGAAHDQGVTILVHDVRDDERHLARFDDETGFDTRAVLCAPIRDGQSFHGVLELLNPAEGFEAWHVEATEAVARTLATTLGAR